MSHFDSFELHADLRRAVQELGFTEPTAIQRDAIPPGLEGRDVLGCASTGSGKTAAFGLPILNQLLKQPRGRTRALILAPTRELAAQIHEHLQLLGRYTRLTGAAIFGGVGMGPQEEAFRRGADVLVATPGRLLDHLSRPYARLDGIEHLVLDEADRMLDMGFLPDIRRVLSHVPKQRQTLLFSATLPGPIAELARDMLVNPVTFNIERRATPAKKIAHKLYPVAQTLKSPLLLHLLQSEEMQSVVVFTRTKHRANRLADFLSKHGVACERIHGNRSQSQRTNALASFRSGEARVLVATDIAARGIDVHGLSHVVNFDVPNVTEDYIHRVGRTARAEASGDAVTFVSPDEEACLRDIEKALGKSLPRAKADGFDYQSSGIAPSVPPPPRQPRGQARPRAQERPAAPAPQPPKRSSGTRSQPTSSAPVRESRGSTQDTARSGSRSRRGRRPEASPSPAAAPARLPSFKSVSR
ncbi:MAG: DEAD/DEAH box helicase [Armatimonadota bacterium]